MTHHLTQITPDKPNNGQGLRGKHKVWHGSGVMVKGMMAQLIFLLDPAEEGEAHEED